MLFVTAPPFRTQRIQLEPSRHVADPENYNREWQHLRTSPASSSSELPWFVLEFVKRGDGSNSANFSRFAAPGGILIAHTSLMTPQDSERTLPSC